MKLLDKIEKFNVEAQQADENYKQWGTTREAHQKKMLEFIHQKMEENGLRPEIDRKSENKS